MYLIEKDEKDIINRKIDLYDFIYFILENKNNFEILLISSQ